MAERQLGVTAAVSTALPTEGEKQASDQLLEELRRQGTFESAVETQRRYKVLESLQKIANAFVKRVATAKFPQNPTLLKDARAKIFTYGSFRLGVFGPGSDIDTLVVAPRYVSRVEYFQYFPDMLQAMAPPGSITGLTAVEDAYVPIIKFEYSGISIDLIFSRVILTQLPGEKDWSLKDSNLLRGLDERELRSLNGTRVTDEIIQLVPEQRTFRDALRTIKLWAQRRAIYGNIMAFPGGVAWAMLVARVCQLYPRATCSTVVSKFFGIMLRWPWPQPVLLKPVEDGPLNARVWNPAIYKGDSYNLMPVITPAYPSMCSTFNITQSSLTVITRELQRASDLTQLIVSGKKPWKALFTKHTFFTQDYKYYILVTSTSSDKENMKIWSGFVESKVRMMVQGLERHPSIALARAFNKGTERKHRCKGPVEIDQVQNGSLSYVFKSTPEPEETVNVELKIEPKVEERVDTNGTTAKLESSSVKVKGEEDADHTVPMDDIKPHVDEKESTESAEPTEPKPTEVFTLTHYIGVELAHGAKSLDLSSQVNDFKQLCFGWEKYKESLVETCFLSIQHVRNLALPDDLFEAGELKPTKPLKKRSPTASVPSPKKRPAPETPGPAAKRQQNSSVPAGIAG